MRWILFITFALLPLSALADNEARLIAFTEGRYSEAANITNQDAGADSYAFAARSLLAEAMSAEDFVPPQALIEQAEYYARLATTADPRHIEGRLQLAIALSLRARPLSTREAIRTGYGEASKELALAVLEDDPSNPYAHGFMAVWHIEVRRRGGSIGASLLGASIKKGRKHYQTALEHRPKDASIHWQYARALTALNAKKYRSEIETALQAAVTCGTESELEALMQDRAETLESALASEPRKSVEALAMRML